MKSTGVTRRIDELGRVVIPKEIRKTTRMREGEEVEVFVSGDNEVVLKKHSDLKSLGSLAEEFGKIISKRLDGKVDITDKDEVIASSVKGRAGKRVSAEIEKIIERRTAVEKDVVSAEGDDGAENALVVPIVVRGDVMGSVVFKKTAVSDDEKRLLETACELLTVSLE